MKVGQVLKIITKGGIFGHHFKVGTDVVFKGIENKDRYRVEGMCDSNKITQVLSLKDFEIIKTDKDMTTEMKNAVITTANKLALANNTFTTLEIKVELIKTAPQFYWKQADISEVMDNAAKTSDFTFTDNGTFRTYSSTKVTKKVQTKPLTIKSKISKTKALDLMMNNKGHFFTVEFVKQDGTLRKLNGQYVKDQKQSALGYVLVKEASKLKANEKNPIRNVNVQTLRSLKIGGILYKIS